MSALVLRRSLWGLTAAYWLMLFVLTHIPQGQGPDAGIGDKLAHVIAYGLLAAALFSASWATWPRSWHAAWIVPVICVAYGAIDEWLQGIPFVNRSCELADWYADAAGMALAMAVLILIRLAAWKFRPTVEVESEKLKVNN